MKTLFTLFFWMVFLIGFSSLSGYTQEGMGFLMPETGVKLSKQENERYLHFRQRKIYKDVVLVNTKRLHKYQRDQKVSFYIPGIDDLVQARAKKIEAESLESYLWTGQIRGKYEGSVILRADQGLVYGIIRVDGQAYELFSLRPGLSMLGIYDRASFQGAAICGMSSNSLSNVNTYNGVNHFGGEGEGALKNIYALDEFFVRTFPNPVVSDGTINLSMIIPGNGSVRADLIDETGKTAQQLYSGEESPGRLSISGNLDDLNPGMYFLRTVWRDEVLTNRIIVVR